jgi:hypothetical protein
MIVPGNPTVPPPIAPFQVTFAGYDHPDATVQPQLTFRYTPAGGEAISDGGLSDFSLGSDPVTGDLTAVPDIDVIPTDVGSAPATAAPAAGGETAPPTARTQPAGSGGGGFPAVGWLLVPLALIAFWGAGTALGPAGDPILAREGGVSRVLAARRAAQPMRS